jgi:HK97 gp10 family phage protein
MRRSLRKGANVIKASAIQKARGLDDPTTSENIAKNVSVHSGGIKRERQVGGPMMRVGILGGARDMSQYGEIKGAGAGNPGGDTFYWRFLEFGTSKMHARPFMRPAMNESAGAAFHAVGTDMAAQIDKEIAKLK